MKIRWLGHAAFEVEAKEAIICIDPFLSGNPKAAAKPEEIEKADLIFVTHDHSDHLGDAIDIAKRTGATVVAIPELAAIFTKEGIETHAINIGSFSEVKGVRVALVQAFHSCERGQPVGILFEVEDKVIYHLGDTGIFRDLEVIADIYKPKIVLVPIGGFYTMGPKEAAKAIEYLKPKVAIPMHYGTYPVLVPTANDFILEVEKTAPEVKVIVLSPGESYEE